MTMQHELIGKKLELNRELKKYHILASAVTHRLIKMLNQVDYEMMDSEDLQLSAEIISEAISKIKTLSKKIRILDAELGT